MAKCTLVIIPGLAASPKAWQPMKDYLMPYCDVTVVDNGEQGLSRNCHPDISIESMAKQLIEDLLLIKKSDPMVLLGHSMGALIALAACSLAPELFSSAILVSPPVRATVYLRKTLKTFTKIHKQVPAAEFVSLAMLQNMNSSFINAHEGLFDFAIEHAEESLSLSNEIYVNQVNAVLQFDALIVLPQIKIPLRIISGSGDPLANPIDVRSSFENLPNAKVLLIDQVGHAIATEVPEYFQDLVVGYLMRFVS